MMTCTAEHVTTEMLPANERFLAAGIGCSLLFDGQRLKIQRTDFQFAVEVDASKWLAGAAEMFGAFSPKGEFCAVLRNGMLCILGSKELKRLGHKYFNFDAKEELFTCVAMSDSGIAATATTKGFVDLYTTNGKHLEQIQLNDKGLPVTSLSFVGNVLYAVGPEGTARITLNL